MSGSHAVYNKCEAGSTQEYTNQWMTCFLGIFAAAATIGFILPGIVSAGAGYGSLHGLRGMPLALGHAHNDEAHAWPLQTALAEGAKGSHTVPERLRTYVARYIARYIDSHLQATCSSIYKS